MTASSALTGRAERHAAGAGSHSTAQVKSKVGAGLAQLLFGPLRGLRAGDVDWAAAPRMTDRAVDHGMWKITR
jgi:hypothetical protein